MNPPDRLASPSSPCIGVCQLDREGRMCTGCLRTTAEIALWSQLDEVARLEVLRRVAQRVASRDRSRD